MAIWVIIAYDASNILATGHLYNVVRSSCGVFKNSGRVYSRCEDDHGSGQSRATTVARRTTIGDDWLVRDVVRLTILQVLNTMTVVPATPVT